MRNAARSALLAAFAAVVACGGNGTGPSDHAPRTIGVAGGNGQQATVGTAVTTAPTFVVKDKSGSVVSGVSVTFAVTAGGGSLGAAVATTDANGHASPGSWTLGTAAGVNSIAASAASLTPATVTATALSGPAAALVFVTAPSATGASGVALAQQPVLQLKDQFGNNTAQPVLSVVAAIATGGGTLGGTATMGSGGSGLVTFTNLSISGAIGARTVSFTAPAIPVLSSGTITVSAGPAATVSANSSTTLTGTAGAAVTPLPSVLVADASGNPVQGASVTFAVVSGGGAVTGATQLTSASGIATVGSWTLGGTAGAQSLSATVGALTPVTFSATANPGAASRLTLSTQPSATAVSGLTLGQQPVVRIEDGFGNLVTTATSTVAAAVQGAGASLGGGTSVAAVNGVATFATLRLTGTVGNYSLAFSAGGLSGTTSAAIALGAGAATTMVLNAGDNQNAVVGTAVAVAPSVLVTDSSGNPVSGTAVNFAVVTGGGSVTGASTTTNASGIATVGSWTLGSGAGSNTMDATSAGLAGSPVSFTATGTPGPGSLFTISTQPSANASNGVALVQQPVIQLRDQANNPVSLPGVVVTATVASGGGALAGGTTATTDAGGTASFSGLIVNGLVGTKTLRFSATGVTGVTSGNIVLAAGAASQLVVVTQPSASAVNGATFATQPSVRLEDVGGNFVLQAGTAVTVAIASGGGALGGVLTVNTDAGGLAAYSGLGITGLVGSRTLGFSASGLAPATSGAIAITASAATTITINAGDAQTATVGAAVSTAPSVLVTDQSGNPVSGVAVTFAVATGGGSLTGGSASSNASGIAAVGSWTLGTVAGSNTLTATSGGLTGSPITFTATGTAGAATKLAITTEPPASATVGAALAPQPVLQLRDQFDNNAGQAGVVVTATIFSGGGSVAGGTTATTNGSGVASFSGLIVNGVATSSQVLRFTSGTLTAVNATAITLTAGAASQLVLTTQPSSSATNGLTFGTQPVIQLRDAGGNNVSQAGVSIAAGVTGTPAGIALGGTTPVLTNASGVATFTNLALTGAVGSYTLTFSKSGLTSAISTSITTVAGAPANVLGISASTQAGRVGAAAAVLPQVKVVDASGNAVSGASVTFSVSAGGGSVTGATPTTDGLGLATVGGWTLGKTVTTNTVTATVGALPTVSFDATATFVVSRVAGGGSHSCAITVDGVAYCWGDNTNGAIGDNGSAPHPTPVPVSSSAVFSSIAAGLAHSCAVTAAGAGSCWGLNTNGQLGNGGTALSRVPSPVSGGLVFALLDLGTDHSCGVTTGGGVDCWGANLNGQLGDGVTSAGPQSTPLQVVASGFNQISSGVFFTCGAKATGAGNCWGNNTFGQLGDSTKGQRVVPTLVKGGLTFAEVVSSQTHACGRTTGGAVYCWGLNLNGRLAQDTVTLLNNESLVPKLVTGLTGVAQLAAGQGHTCARTSGGAVFCWGLNDSGQLGDGSFSNRQVATPITLPLGVSGFASISAGAAHSCGVTSAGALYCWGDNFTGQLGDGSGSDQPVPVLVANP